MKYMFFSAIYFIPLVIFIRVLANVIFKKTSHQTTWLHEIGVGLFILYLFGLFSQTVDFSFLVKGNIHFQGRINLIPFKGIRQVLNTREVQYIAINILGNIFVFSPVGFFLPLLWKKFNHILLATFCGFLLSLFIETMQLFQYRGTDVDDLILNTAGALVGYGCYLFFRKYFYTTIGKFRLQSIKGR